MKRVLTTGELHHLMPVIRENIVAGQQIYNDQDQRRPIEKTKEYENMKKGTRPVASHNGAR